MTHNFIADVRKGGYMLKSFEQSNLELANTIRSFAFKL